MRSIATFALLFFSFNTAEAQSHGLNIIYVRAEAMSDAGNGSHEHPFRRITDALALVRVMAAANPNERFRIDVGPGTYTGAYSATLLATHPDWEVLPLWVDVSHVEIRGSTRIESGLGRGEALDLNTDTLLTVGERILSTVAGGLAAGSAQAVMVLGPTTRNPSVTDDAVRGLHFDGIFHDGVGVFVDRVAEFSVEHSVFERLGTGTRSRGSSGSWSHNYAGANSTGSTLTGGSSTHPSELNLVGNRCVGNDEIGMLLNATGTYGIAIDPGQSGLIAASIQTVFDLSNATDVSNIPDTLSANVLDGDYSDNGWIGFRLFELGVRTNSYTTASINQSIATHYDIHFSGNAVERNGFSIAHPFGYGLSLDAGFPNRVVNGATQPIYTGSYQLELDANTFGANRTAGLFAGFTRFGITNAFKPLRSANIDLRADLAPDAVYDVPQCDPFDLAHGPLGDELRVNGISVEVNGPFCP